MCKPSVNACRAPFPNLNIRGEGSARRARQRLSTSRQCGADAIVAHLAPQLRVGDVVAVMSNGGFDRIHEKLLAALGASGEKAEEVAGEAGS